MASDWSFADHRREMTRVMNRRAVEPVAAPAREPREPRTGKYGYLHHPRLGLVGAVGYWAGGSLGLVVTMLVALIVRRRRRTIWCVTVALQQDLSCVELDRLVAIGSTAILGQNAPISA